MPATIIGNANWNQRGLVLTRQDAQEQVNGLVNVQVEYVGPSSKHDIIARSFYADAAPPIWPSVVSRDELLTNRLYLESRSVTRANGLTTVRASYVGGLVRAGFSGYYLRTTKETGIKGVALPAEGLFYLAFSVIENINNPNLSNHYTFTGDFIRHTMEFVQIGNSSAYKPPNLTFRDMFAPQSAASRVFAFGPLKDPNTIFSSYAILLGESDQFPVVGTAVKLGDYTPPKFVDQPSYLTPTVKVISREFYF